jgi:hypothetical protein
LGWSLFVFYRLVGDWQYDDTIYPHLCGPIATVSSTWKYCFPTDIKTLSGAKMGSFDQACEVGDAEGVKVAGMI